MFLTARSWVFIGFRLALATRVNDIAPVSTAPVPATAAIAPSAILPILLFDIGLLAGSARHFPTVDFELLSGILIAALPIEIPAISSGLEMSPRRRP